MKNLLITISLASLLLSCNSSKPGDTGSEDQSDPTYSLSELWRTDSIMKTCESVLFDKTRNVLFVACINGSPADKNGSGYISMLDPDGAVKCL